MIALYQLLQLKGILSEWSGKAEMVSVIASTKGGNEYTILRLSTTDWGD